MVNSAFIIDFFVLVLIYIGSIYVVANRGMEDNAAFGEHITLL